jgi:ketosteroid isomerase-like protein
MTATRLAATTAFVAGLLLACAGQGSLPDPGPGSPDGTPAASTAAIAGLPAGSLHLQQVDDLDPTGFGRRMVAARALVPVGWTTEGGVVWSQEPCTEPARFNWSAVSADGLERIVLFPTETWASSNSVRHECIEAGHRDMESYLRAYVAKNLSGATAGEYRARPDFLEAKKDYVAALTASFAQLGMQAKADAGELRYQVDRGGVAVTGLLAASGMLYSSSLQDPMGGPPLWYLTGGTQATFAAEAPTERFDAQRVEAMRRSIVPDPVWITELFALQDKLGQAQTQAVRERAAVIVAGGAAMTRATIATNQAATAGYAERSATNDRINEATNDRIHQATIDSIRGVERYSDPVSETTVQLDNTYDHAWRINDGSYVLVNDPNFNPTLSLGVEGQELRRQQ